jgi:multidrug efflux pump subunit AcrB
VDYINVLRLDGKERLEAIVEAGKTRMRPIFITALTTILGLSVMALGIGTGAEMMQPLAIVCIGGLLYATLMTLYIIPLIYDALNKKELKAVSDKDLELIEE